MKATITDLVFTIALAIVALLLFASLPGWATVEAVSDPDIPPCAAAQEQPPIVVPEPPDKPITAKEAIEFAQFYLDMAKGLL